MAGSGFSDYVPEEKFLGPPSPKNLATPLLLTYRKMPFADKLWTLEKKGHFIILELNSGLIKWPYFLPKVFSL